MLPAFLLALREGLEAALIIGILLGALRKLSRNDLQPVVWKGVASAILVSLVAAVALQALGASLEGAAEQIFEGFTMLAAAAVLTWMIFWMRRQARYIRGSLETEVKQAITGQASTPLFALAFLAIVREGIELALFLTAATFASDSQTTLIGALLGLAAAVALGWLLFASTKQLNLRAFFQVTGLLLLFFAAGLVAHGVHEFNEVGWIPPVIEHLWDINHIVDEKSTIGSILKALFGYNGNPSLTEVLAYFAYLVAVLIGVRRQNQPSLEPAR